MGWLFMKKNFISDPWIALAMLSFDLFWLRILYRMKGLEGLGIALNRKDIELWCSLYKLSPPKFCNPSKNNLNKNFFLGNMGYWKCNLWGIDDRTRCIFQPNCSGPLLLAPFWQHFYICIVMMARVWAWGGLMVYSLRRILHFRSVLPWF